MVGVAGCEFASVVGGAEKAGAAGVYAVIQATALGQAGDRVEAFFFAAGRIEVGDIGFGVGVVGVVGVVIGVKLAHIGSVGAIGAASGVAACGQGQGQGE